MTDAGTHLTQVPDIAGEPKQDGVSVATTRLLLVTGDELEALTQLPHEEPL